MGTGKGALRQMNVPPKDDWAVRQDEFKRAVNCLRSGDLDAPEVTAWFTRHTNMLRLTALRWHVPYADIDDVIQDFWKTFTKAREWERLDFANSPSTYLRNAFRWLLHEHWRQRRLHSNDVPMIDDLRIVESDPTAPMLMEKVLESLGMESGEPGWVLYWKVIGGLSYGELSHKSGKTISALKVEFMRAKAKARRLLNLDAASAARGGH